MEKVQINLLFSKQVRMLTKCPSILYSINEHYRNYVVNKSTLDVGESQIPFKYHEQNVLLGDIMKTVGVDITKYQDLSRKCASENYSHWRYTQPVTDSDGVIYRNWYCSQCFSMVKR